MFKDIQDIKEFIEFAKVAGIKKFKIGDAEFEFNEDSNYRPATPEELKEWTKAHTTNQSESEVDDDLLYFSAKG